MDGFTVLADGYHVGGIRVLVACAAACAAGVVNALAGGGTLLSFPALTALGLPALAANVTNTVALCPGYLGATVAQGAELRSQWRRALVMAPAAAVGGAAGGLLLLHTPERAFRAVVPFLILFACLLLALQEPVRRALDRRRGVAAGPVTEAVVVGAAIALAAVYGGYFGAGLSVLVLAVLGVLVDESLTTLNALKQLVALCTNVTAALVFVASGRVEWTLAAVMAVGALAGGAVGGRLAGRVAPATLRMLIVSGGVLIALVYLVRS